MQTLCDYIEASGGIEAMRLRPCPQCGAAMADNRAGDGAGADFTCATCSHEASASQVSPDPILTRIVEKPGHAMPYFECRCGRVVAADMMIDLDPPVVSLPERVPHSKRGACVNRPQCMDGRRFVCDGCWTHWIRAGEVTRDEFRHAVGAPSHTPGRAAAW